MKLITSLLISVALTFSVVGVVAHTDRAAAASGCGLTNAVFCDTFDAPAGVGTRSGDLSSVWGVSRATGNVNAGGNQLQGWVPTVVDVCGVPTPAVPPLDVRICNGQLREASSDGGAVTVLAAYPKQPFDFAGRTGKIVFDVSDDTQGTHGAWPELWVTDKPIPAPFVHFGAGWGGPQNAFGIRFGLECNNATGTGVDSAVTFNNYTVNDSAFGGSLPVTIDGCVTKGVLNGGLNHFEVWVSQAQIDVYGTGPGGGPLVHLANIAANLSFTKGLIWIQDVHYNAVKAREPGETGIHKTHTFAWDNVAFDGPYTYRDLSYDVLDSLTPGGPAQDGHATVNLGWKGTSTDAVSVRTLPMAGSEIAAATKAYLLFSLTNYDAPLTISYGINGHPYAAAWPFPDTGTFETRTTYLPVTLADLVPGQQAVTISTGTTIVVANVNIVLVAAGSPPSGASAPPPPTATPTATPTPTRTPTPTPTPTLAAAALPTPTPTPTATATRTPTPTSAPAPTSTPAPTPSTAPSAPASGTPAPSSSLPTTPTLAPQVAATAPPVSREPAGPAAPVALPVRALPIMQPTPPGPEAYHAGWFDQSSYATMQVGQLKQVTMRFRNTGAAPWVKGVVGKQANLGVFGDTTPYVYPNLDAFYSAMSGDPVAGMSVDNGAKARVLSQSPTISSLLYGDWPTPDRVAVQKEPVVQPGALGTFTFTVRAPLTPGVYQLRLRPVIDGTVWMEDAGAFILVTSLANYHSAWVSQSTYPILHAGETSAPITMVFRNTGGLPWTKGVLGEQVNLGVVGEPTSVATLGANWPAVDRVAIQNESRVAPGGTATFTFTVRAPEKPGIYVLPLQPVVDGIMWLEDQGAFMLVTVLP